MEKKENPKKKPMRLKDKNYLLKRDTSGAFAEEDRGTRKLLESGEAYPWDLLREG